MQSSSSYPTPSSDTHVSPDNSLQSSFPDGVRSHQQQESAPNPMWYPTWRYVDGQGVPWQIFAVPLSTGPPLSDVYQTPGTPMLSPTHFQSSSAQPSTLQGAFGTVGPRDHASYLPDGAENADVFMPPNAPPVLHVQPHTLHQVHQEHAPPFNPPPHDDGLPSSHDAVEAGEPAGTFEHSHVNPNHFGAVGFRDETGFFGSHQSLSPLSNVVLPPGHVHSERSPAPVTPPIVRNIADETVTSAGTIPFFHRTTVQPGRDENREGTHSDYQDGLQHTEHHDEVPCSNFRNAPTQITAPVVSDPVIQVPPVYPTPSHGHQGPANAAVATGSSVTTLVTANVPAIQGPLQIQPSGDLRPCTWRNNQGEICGEMLSYECAGHLATAHGITKMSRTTLVLCGACGSTLTRGSFLRHFREVHLRYPREN
ncbi:hypothetical protein EDC04DRAFT_449415 [Pisolithus marmoratus]|nr:hypothetical protein EDC04DRAFT_449415 [Pisolithus marmoratus]